MTEPVSTEVLPTSPSPSTRRSYRRLMRDRSFRRLWLSQFVSGLGDWLVIGLLMPLVTDLSGGSSFAVAGILIAKIVPSLLFGSVIGVFVDRFDRRRLMIACDLTRAALVLGLLFTNSLAVIYLVVFAMEVASLFFYPAKNALIPRMVDCDDVAAANGLSYTTQQASMLVGLTASGAILAVFERVVRVVLAADPPFLGRLVGLIAPERIGPRAGVFLDSLTFLVSAAAITLMTVPRTERGGGRLDLRLVGAEVAESFRFLGSHRELRAFLVTIGLAILGGGAIVPVGTVYVAENLAGELPLFARVGPLEKLVAAPQSFMLVFLALGMVAGALVVPRLAGRARLQVLFLAGIAGFGSAMLGFASVDLYGVAALFAIAAGFALATVTVTGNTYVAETVEDAIRGRVFTALEVVIRVSLLASMVVTAPLGDLVGTLVRRLVEASGTPPAGIYLTGSRLTLQLAAIIVLGAAVYAATRLDWRSETEGA